MFFDNNQYLDVFGAQAAARISDFRFDVFFIFFCSSLSSKEYTLGWFRICVFRESHCDVESCLSLTFSFIKKTKKKKKKKKKQTTTTEHGDYYYY